MVEKSQTWFTSDWHLGHAKVIEFEKRPFGSVDEMNQALIENYQKKVQPQDRVFFLGDLSFTTFLLTHNLVQPLKGAKFLVQGNHDRLSEAQYRKMGFQIVAQEMVLDLFGRFIKLSHFPRLPTDEALRNDPHEMRYLDRRPPHDGRWLLHGHCHGKNRLNPLTKSVHIGVDAWDYGPVNQREIESLIARAEAPEDPVLSALLQAP